MPEIIIRRIDKMYKTLLIKDVYAGEIFDSGGRPAIEIKILAGKDAFGRSVVAYQGSGKGIKHRGDDFSLINEKTKSRKNDIYQTVEYINSVLAQSIIGVNVFQQEEIDCLLEEMIRGGKINDIAVSFGISSAIARAAACALNLPLFKYLGGVGKSKVPIPAVGIFSDRCSRYSDSERRKYMLVPGDRKEMVYDGLSMCCDVICEMYEIFRENGTFETDAVFFMRDKHIREVYSVAQLASERTGYKMGKDLRLVFCSDPVKLTGTDEMVWNMNIRDGADKDEISIITINPEDSNTISGILEYAGNFCGMDRKTAFSVCYRNYGDELNADLAAALGTDYFFGGVLSQGEDVAAFNRLIQIQNEIISRPGLRVAWPGCC